MIACSFFHPWKEKDEKDEKVKMLSVGKQIRQWCELLWLQAGKYPGRGAGMGTGCQGKVIGGSSVEEEKEDGAAAIPGREKIRI